jgi:hypothetical protein
VANAGEPSFAEWVTDGENGFLVELSAPKWAVAIQKSSKFDDEKKRKISKNISAQVSSDVIDDHYIRLMRELSTSSADTVIDVEKVLTS